MIKKANDLYSEFTKPSFSVEDHKKRLISNSNLSISFILGSNEIRQLKSNLTGSKDHPYQKIEIVFDRCDFDAGIDISNDAEVDLVFNNCNFTNFGIEHTTQTCKLKFRHCTFKEINTRNTEFGELIDVYNCQFSDEVNFFKTDFRKNAVFAACRFNKNVLFTYSSIDKELILRNTHFNSGLDLSLSLGSGTINCFGIHLSNFKGEIINSKSQSKYEEYYNTCVAESNLIPLENKKETYRKIKHSFNSLGNLNDALHYEYLEKKALEEILIKDIKLLREGSYNNRASSILTLYAEKTSLTLNRMSNLHKKSWLRSCFFILFSGIFCFFFSSIGSGQYEFDWCFSWPTFVAGVNHFMLFLSPVHSVDYLGKHETLNFGFYFFDFLGRIAVGYGIYQLVQAFRKLK